MRLNSIKFKPITPALSQKYYPVVNSPVKHVELTVKILARDDVFSSPQTSN